MIDRTVVISFPLDRSKSLDSNRDLIAREDKIGEPYPPQCTYVFRRNFGRVFEKVFVAKESLEFHAGKAVCRDFVFFVRRNIWFDGKMTCFAVFRVTEDDGREAFTSDQIKSVPEFVRFIEAQTGVNLQKIEQHRIGASMSKPIPEFQADMLPCAAFYHAGWIRLLNIEREQFSAKMTKLRYLGDYLRSIAQIRAHISEIKIIFLTEERSNNPHVQKFCDQIRQKLKIQARYDFLAEVSDQLEKYSNVASVLRSLNTARAIATTLGIFSVALIGLELLNQAQTFNEQSNLVQAPKSILLNPLFYATILGGLAAALVAFLSVFALVRVVRKDRV